MSDRYKIRARVLPFEVPNNSQATEDARLVEKKIFVPINGSQTVGDLYFEIQRIYSELYTQAGELRIRCLETGDGDLLHTSLLISDCFERRTSAIDSSQWTVIVRRQAPTHEEVEEYKRNARQFSFDDLSFARPQMPYSRGLPEHAQEMSTTPIQKRLSLYAPIQPDAADNLVPSTERDGEELQATAVWRSRRSPSLVPNSQLPQVAIRSSLNTAPGKIVQEELIVAPTPKAVVIQKPAPHRLRDADATNELAQSSEPSLHTTRTQIIPNGIAQAPQPSTKINEKPAPRGDIFDLNNLRDTTPQPTLERRRTPSPELHSPQSHHSSSSTQSLVAFQQAKPQGKANSSRTPELLETAADTDKPSANKRRKVENLTAEQSTAKLEASLAQERVEMQKLVSNLPITPSKPRSQKLTPFFPHSINKLTSGSTQTRATPAAIDTGIELLQDDPLRPRNVSSPSRLATKQPAYDFSPDHFKELDRRVMATFKDVDSSKKVAPKSNGIKKTKQASHIQSVDTSDSESETDQELPQNGAPKAPHTSPPTHSNKPSDQEEESMPEDAAVDIARPKTTVQKAAAKKKGPVKNQAAKAIKTAANKGSSSARSSFSTGSETQPGPAGQPAKRGRGRPPGSKAKPQQGANNVAAPKIAAPNPGDGTVQKKRGRPFGSKNKNKAEVNSAAKPPKPTKPIAKKKVLSASIVESDSEEPMSSTAPNGNKNKTLDTKPNAAKRKIEQKGNTEPVKRMRKASDSSDVANAGAMDESIDREAVVSAADAMEIDNSPATSQESPLQQSKESPPAQHEKSAAHRESPSPPTRPNIQAQHEKPVALDVDSDTESTSGTSDEESQTGMAEPEKSIPKVTTALQDSSYDSRQGYDSDNEPKLPPLYSEITITSADPASAQLQIEETASLEEPKSIAPKVNASAPKRPVSAFPSAHAKYASFSEIKKQQASQSSQQLANSTQMKLHLGQKAPQQPPAKSQTSSDDSESSSESDSETDDQEPGTDGKPKHPKGFHRLLRKMPKQQR